MTSYRIYNRTVNDKGEREETTLLISSNVERVKRYLRDYYKEQRKIRRSHDCTFKMFGTFFTITYTSQPSLRLYYKIGYEEVRPKVFAEPLPELK